MKKLAVVLTILFAMPIIMLAQTQEKSTRDKARSPKLEKMASELNLTQFQVSEIERINSDYKTRKIDVQKIEIEDERILAMKALKSQQKEEIIQVLNENQREAYKDFHVKRKNANRNKMQNHHK
jgi:hypothetical protein